MGFIRRRTSKQIGKVKTLLGLALTRLAVAFRPHVARRSISSSDVGQLLALGHLDRALHRAEHVIEEDNILEAFNIVELYCNHLIENAKQLDKPHECGEDTREAVAGVMFAAGWCGDLPELLFARTILENKFGGDFAMMAKDGTGVVDPMLVWKFSGNKRNMELKKNVVKNHLDTWIRLDQLIFLYKYIMYMTLPLVLTIESRRRATLLHMMYIPPNPGY
ncbi:hypothetical protein HU200_022861 [Digitaria exilis]|uniref:IST1 homolog n=1 Tax=Digitaria exilis TaxID=1010633 RepID=A0A835C0Q2_9POAL|nr:hypothetical protein HU200_022861 [Digitaria exilis]